MENKDKENRFLYNNRALLLTSFYNDVEMLRKDIEQGVNGIFVLDCLKAHVQAVYNNDEQLVEILRKFFDSMKNIFVDKHIPQQDLIDQLNNLSEYVYFLIEKELE